MGCLSQLINFCISPFSQYSHLSVFMSLPPTLRFLLPQSKWSNFLRYINNKDSTQQAGFLGAAQELSVTCIHLLFFHWLLPVVLLYFLVDNNRSIAFALIVFLWESQLLMLVDIVTSVMITLFIAFKHGGFDSIMILTFWSALLQDRTLILWFSKNCLFIKIF